MCSLGENTVNRVRIGVFLLSVQLCKARHLLRLFIDSSGSVAHKVFDPVLADSDDPSSEWISVLIEK